MEHSIQVFKYEDHEIEFDLHNNNLMINATEMAKPFGKVVKEFMGNEGTKNFIEECLKRGNSPYINIFNMEDLVISKQKTGTWMHRILAIKFAAWLSPTFEFWVYHTIDQILFGSYRRMEEGLKESAERKNKIDTIRSKMRSSEIYQELERLELEERQAAYRRGLDNRKQLELFRDIL